MWGQKKKSGSNKFFSLQLSVLWTPKEACVFLLAARKSSEERKNRGTERERERERLVISLRRSFSYFRLREERVAKRGIFFFAASPLPLARVIQRPQNTRRRRRKEREFLLHALSKK
jgi:hypothetical protein